MFKLKQSLIACAGLLFAVGLIAILIPAGLQGQGGGNQQPLNVNVVNPTAAPIPVRDITFPAVFQETRYIDRMNDGTSAYSFTIEIPEGKLAVVEHVSFAALLPLGQAARASLTCQGGDASTGHVQHRIPFDPEGVFDVEYQGTVESMSLIVANSPLRCYGDSESGINGSVVRNSATGRTGEVSFSVSGYLLNKPL